MESSGHCNLHSSICIKWPCYLSFLAIHEFRADRLKDIIDKFKLTWLIILPFCIVFFLDTTAYGRVILAKLSREQPQIPFLARFRIWGLSYISSNYVHKVAMGNIIFFGVVYRGMDLEASNKSFWWCCSSPIVSCSR